LELFESANRSGAGNLLTGTMSGIPVEIMTYGHAYGLGRYARNYYTTLVVLPVAAGMPDFILYPSGYLDRPGKTPGWQRVELPDQPEFNRQYVLRGVAPVEIAARFSPDAVRLCLLERELVGESNNGLLLVGRWRKTPPA